MANKNLTGMTLSVASGTEGTVPTWSSVETAGNSGIILYDTSFNDATQRYNRNPISQQMGSLKSISTRRQGTISLTTELKGSGVAGTPPLFAPLLKACGMEETITSGSASIGSVVSDPNNFGTVAPTVGGTFTGTESGTLEITVSSVTADTSIGFLCIFKPGDGTGEAGGSNNQSSDTAVSITGIASGITVDFGDPSSSTSGINVGDKFYVDLVSSSQAQVEYTMRNHNEVNSFIVDMSLSEDGRAQRLYSCRGSFEITAAVDSIAMIKFDMQGIPVDPADISAISGINYGDVSPGAFLGLSSVSKLGYSGDDACFNSITVTQGNTIAMRSCAESAYGNRSARITKREMTGSIDIEAETVANLDTYGLLRGDTESALNFTVGETSGEIVRFESRYAQVSGISPESRDDILVDNLSLQFNRPEYSATDDYSEAKLIFS